MLTTTNDGAAVVNPAVQGDLILQPLSTLSVAFNELVATIVFIEETDRYRMPIVVDDPTAEWVAEGEEITPTDADLTELTVVPPKIAGLSVISSELAADSNPAAQEAVGLGLARDIARKVDAAFVGNLAAPAPKGLAALTGTQGVAAGATWANTDPFAEAVSKAEAVGASLTAFVTGPDDALAMAKVKKATGSNEPLLGPDPTQPTSRTILGVPLVTVPDVPAGVVYGVDATRVVTVVRADTTVEADRSVFFTSDRVAVRAIARIGFGFPHAASIVKITRGS